MRIILLLAAAAGSAAIGSPAPAQTSSMTAAHRGAPPAASGSPSGRLIGSMRPEFRRGMARGPGRHHRPDRGRHRGRHGFDRGEEAFFYPYGFAGPVDLVDPHGTGFFAGSGGEILMRDGRPYYDYDRSYPYEWASAAGGAFDWSEEQVRRAPQCSFERGVRVCRARR